VLGDVPDPVGWFDDPSGGPEQFGVVVLAVIALIALFFSRRIPTKPPSAAPASEPAPDDGGLLGSAQAP
jgi:hypothetical protein